MVILSGRTFWRSSISVLGEDISLVLHLLVDIFEMQPKAYEPYLVGSGEYWELKKLWPQNNSIFNN